MKTLAKNYKHGLKCTKRDVALSCYYLITSSSSLIDYSFNTKFEAINKLTELISLGYPKDTLHLSKIQTIKF